MRLFPESLLHVLIFWLTLFSLIGLAMFMQAVVCKYSNALLRLWILGEVGIIGAKTHPEFADMAVWQVARGMKGV
jgi:hypothetical protein